MKIFVVLQYCPDDKAEIVGLFDSREGAELYLADYAAATKDAVANFQIEELQLNERRFPPAE